MPAPVRLASAALFVAFVFIVVWGNRAAVPDDAMIYLRVAGNIAEGAGWSFNPGEIFNATTSPIHTVLLAALIAAGVPPSTALWTLYAAALSIGGIALHAGLRMTSPVAALAAPVLIVVWSVMLASIGLEVATLFALVTVAALTFSARRASAAGLLAGALALTRPEGIVMGPLLAAAALPDARSDAGRILLGWAAVVAAWAVFSTLTFGSPLPHTATVKSIQADVPPWSEPWLQSFLRTPPGLFLLVPLSALGAISAWRGRGRDGHFSAIVVLFGLVQIAGYTALQAPSAYWWYMVPGGMALIVAATLGIDEIHRQIAMRLPRIPGPLRTLPRVLLLGGLAIGFVLSTAPNYGRPYRLMQEYARIADWLRENAPPNAVLAANEIGYLGYLSRRPIRDMLGLLHADAVEPLQRLEWHWWLAHGANYVLLHDPPWIGEPGAASHAWPDEAVETFHEDHELVHREPGLELYARRPRE